MITLNNQKTFIALTALWAFVEAGLGGFLHALHLPFTGIVLGANGGTGIDNTGKTITLGGNINTGKNPVTELYYGGDITGNKSFTRFIFKFEIEFT